jgi:CRISPR-associated protein Csm4
MLPMPVLPAPSRGEIKARANSQETGGLDLVGLLQHLKKFRKLKWLPIASWSRRRTNLTLWALFKDWLADQKSFKPPEIKTYTEAHNSIDRSTNTVLEEGGLWFSDYLFHEPGVTLDLYVRAADPGLFDELFKKLAETGFGRDRGTGKGHFTWEKDSEFNASELEGVGDHRLSLSVMAASDLTQVQGHYSLFTKQGKVWNGFGEASPFKKPLTAFAEGSVFSRLPDSGYVIRGIHPNPDYVQVAWPLTIPCTLGEIS